MNNLATFFFVCKQMFSISTSNKTINIVNMQHTGAVLRYEAINHCLLLIFICCTEVKETENKVSSPYFFYLYSLVELPHRCYTFLDGKINVAFAFHNFCTERNMKKSGVEFLANTQAWKTKVASTFLTLFLAKQLAQFEKIKK